MKKNINVIFGIIQIILSAFWIYEMALLYYKYHFTNILFAFMYPDWVLILNIILSIISLFFGIKLTMNRISIKKSYGMMGLMIIIGLIANNFYSLFYI